MLLLVYIYMSDSLSSNTLRIFCSPPILYSAGSVRNKIFSLHSDGEKFSGLVTFQVIISSRCWT